jgi:hypothetical protein
MKINSISLGIVHILLYVNPFTAIGFEQSPTISTIAGRGLPTNGLSAISQAN